MCHVITRAHLGERALLLGEGPRALRRRRRRERARALRLESPSYDRYCELPSKRREDDSILTRNVAARSPLEVSSERRVT